MIAVQISIDIYDRKNYLEFIHVLINYSQRLRLLQRRNNQKRLRDARSQQLQNHDSLCNNIGMCQ